jgi:hypothetical protein
VLPVVTASLLQCSESIESEEEEDNPPSPFLSLMPFTRFEHPGRVQPEKQQK